MWCKGRVKQLLDLFFCWICVPFFFLTHQTKVKHGLHGFSLSDAFTLSCLQCDWGHSNDWTLISSPSIWVYVESLRSSWKRLQHTHTYMNTSCLHPANTHAHHCCSLTLQILPLLSSLRILFSIVIPLHPFLSQPCVSVCREASRVTRWPRSQSSNPSHCKSSCFCFIRIHLGNKSSGKQMFCWPQVIVRCF